MTSGNRRDRRERGNALPAVLALAVGVATLSTSYQMQTIRERSREQFDDASLDAYYQAWAQIELVTNMLQTAGYDAEGRNEALVKALARTADPDSGEFIGPDGWPTNVTVHAVNDAAGNPTGAYELRSESRFGAAHKRVRRLFTESSSFASYNYFANEHALGIVGGEDAAFPYEDAPQGTIHSNRELRFFLPDRHFRDTVSAARGFEFVAGARGPGDADGANTFFHGEANDAADVVEGLTDVDIDAIGRRADTLLSLDGANDFAKVILDGDRVHVEHWIRGRFEATSSTERVIESLQAHQQAALRLVEQRADPRAVWIEFHTPPALPQQAHGWVEAFEQGEEGAGRWITRFALSGPGGQGVQGGGSFGPAPRLSPLALPTHGTRTREFPLLTLRSLPAATVGTPSGADATLELPQADGEDVLFDAVPPLEDAAQEWIPASRVATYEFSAARGTIYCAGDILLEDIEDGTRRYDHHVLDGALTLASGDDIYVGDSIVYGRTDADGVLQTAYLNGDTTGSPYVANPDYTGNSVLGLIARGRIQLQPTLPEYAEINASMLSKESQVQAGGLRVEATGVVVETDADAFVKHSLRRLGSIITNRRPVITYVDDENAVTRGFVHGKSVYDVRQRMRPPLGFPTVLRPQMLSTVIGGNL